MRLYFRELLYYSLEIVGGILNLLCALVHFYPKLELGLKVYLSYETNKIRKELEQHMNMKSSELNKADKLMDKAKKESGVGDEL